MNTHRVSHGLMAATLTLSTCALALGQRVHNDTESNKLPAKPLSELDHRREAVSQAYYESRGEPQYTPRVVYGSDDRRDWYEIGAGETVIQSLEQAVCVVVSTSELTNNGDGTYSLSTAAWTSYGGTPICPSEPFRGQLTIGFCSGFLVGSDLIATAGHCVDSGDCGSTAFIFGFNQQSATIGPDTVVSADNVYFCTNVIDQVQAGDLDHSIVQVDRPVVGRTPVPIRRSGSVSIGDPLVMIGHPVTLPKKVDDGGMVQDDNGSTGWFYANVDAYGGNSGSMVANLNTGVVEGILVRGNTDFTTSGGCVISNTCADSGCPDWEECSKTISFASSVPELGLQVMPAVGTTHIGVVGGPFTNDPVVYTLNNPTGSSLDYTVHIVAGGTAPVLIDGGTADLTGTLAAGANTTVSVSLDSSASALPAGIYTTDIDFVDDTNSRTATRTHTLEVGQTGYTVTPGSDFESGGPVGGPFSGSQVYTITSTHPTPVDVHIVASDTWISLSGVAGGPADFTLNGVGDSAAVTVAISSDADTLPAGLHKGTVEFQNASGGAGLATRNVTLDVGRFTYPSTDTPIAINDNSSLTSTIKVADAFCIGDVNVDMDISHTYIGDLILDLESPAGTVVRLHNRTGSSTDNIVTTYDDSSNPPDGPGLLADFNGEIATGVWTLTVSDNAGQDVGTLNSWTLRIATSGESCAPVAQDVDVDVPQNVATAIALLGASPNGPFDTIIESLPANGELSDPNGAAITAVPYTLLGGGTTVTYQPDSGYVGPDGFTYKVNDGVDSNTANVSISVGLPTVIYDFPLDSDPGWSTEGQWAFGVPTGAGSHNPDPTSGATGSNVYGYNLSGDYTDSMPRYALTVGPLDLTGVINTRLEFQRWLGVESSSFDHASIEVSTNGTTWTVLWDHSGDSMGETSWSLQSFDISAIADNHLKFYVRWIMGTTDTSVTYSGWNIDDVQIIGVVPAPSCPGDTDGDGDVDITDLGAVLAHFGGPGALADGDVNGDGQVNITDLGEVLANFGAPCP